MSKDNLAILREISNRLQRPTIKFIHQTVEQLQPQAKGILDEVLDNFGDQNPRLAFVVLTNEVLNTAFATGFILGAIDTREATKALISEWQQSDKSLTVKMLGREISAEDLVGEIPGAKKAN